MRKLLLSVLLASGLTLSGAGVFAAGEHEGSDAEQKQQTEQTQEQKATGETQAKEGQDAGLTLSEINDNPNKYIGQTVTISGEIEEFYGQRAFVIDEQGAIFNDEMLVVTNKELPNAPKGTEDEAWFEWFEDNDSVVQVTGTVNRFVEVEIEREIDWDLQPEIEAEFKNKLVLIADSVKVMPGENEQAATESE